MACLPEGGGCERPLTDAFAAHVNAEEGTDYRHVRCLDVHSGGKKGVQMPKEPEALYRDARTGAELVIEHKNIVWPHDYGRRHKNDHLLHEAFAALLAGLTRERPHQLELAPLFPGSDEDCRRFAEEVSARIEQNFLHVQQGGVLRESTRGHPWSFRELEDWELEDGQPRYGVVLFSWSNAYSGSDEQMLARVNSELTKFFASCEKKFEKYSSCRRVLVLSPHGDLDWKLSFPWAEHLASVGVPSFIDEVWTSFYENEDFVGLQWHWQRVHPAPPVERVFPNVPDEVWDKYLKDIGEST